MNRTDTAFHTPTQQGDGVDLPVVQARGAERKGLIWVLAISLSAAVIALGGYWLLNYAHFAQVAGHQS